MENKIGTSMTTRYVLRWISDEKRNELDMFCSACGHREYKKFDSLDQALMHIPYYKFSDKDLLSISHYSGFSHFSLNRAAKGTWTSDENGDMKRHEQYNTYVEDLRNTIEDNQSSLGNIRVYRGVPLKYFREYGISSIEELECLEGQFLLDRGFVSTSLVEDLCFYRKDPNNGINYDVMIEYLVPEEFEDGICLGANSVYVGEGEYLINTWNMAQVIGVKREDEGAIVQAALVPKYVYDEAYAKKTGNVK